MLRHLRIRSKLFVVVAIPVIVLVLSGLLAYTSIQAIKINGPTYEKIKVQDDLIADILPPPEFAVEAYATALQLLFEAQQLQAGNVTDADVGHRARAAAKLAATELAFEERHTYWTKVLSGSSAGNGMQPSRDLLDNEVYQTGKTFFAIVDNEFLPAITVGDLTKADEVRDLRLAPSFEAHQAAVEKLVTVAEARSVALEAGAKRSIRNRLLGLLATLVGAIAACVILGTIISRTISRPIAKMTELATHTASVGLPNAIASITDVNAEEGSHELAEFPVTSRDELGELATAFNAVQAAAVGLAGQQVRLNRNYGENLITIGRRNQGLVFRTLGLISELERNERDAGTLENLFRLDHLTTRMRRQAESLLVLAGDAPASSVGGPVDMADAVRGALSEVDDYQRVDHSDMDVVSVKGRYVHSVVHLLAELVENAISYSPPTARVTLLGRMTSSGYHIAIIDRGLGMSSDEIAEANERLTDPSTYDLAPVRVLGHHVVSKLSERFGIMVKLHDNLPAPGLTASVLLPMDMLGSDLVMPGSTAPKDRQAPAPAPKESPVVRTERDAERVPTTQGVERRQPNSVRGDEGVMTERRRFPQIWPPPNEYALFVPPPASWEGDAPPAPQVGEMTKTGFPKRIRGAQTPDTGPVRTEPEPERDAEALRSSLSGLQSGFDRAKNN